MLKVTRCEFVHNLKCEEVSRHINELHELVRDMWWQLLNAYDRKEVDEFADRMRELGIEVER